LGGVAIIMVYLVGRPLLARAFVKVILVALEALGTISYELFLLHQPLIREYPRYVISALGIEATQTNLILGIVGGLMVAIPLSLMLKTLVWKVFTSKVL
jgi:peptidoglycan/LPS O-acetylase OafA/YrhL